MTETMMTFGEELAKTITAISGLETEIKGIDKINGGYASITVRRSGDPIGVALRLDPYAHQFQKDGDIHSAAVKAAKDAVQALEHVPKYGKIISGNISAADLIPEAINSARNKDLLISVPHIDICDLSIIFRIEIETDSSCILNRQLLDHLRWNETNLFNRMLPEIATFRPADVAPLSDVLSAMTGTSVHGGSGIPSLYVATTRGGTYGAGILAYPHFLNQCSKIMRGDFCLLPSSIHEFLILPLQQEMNVNELMDMVTEINANEVKPEDRLSDNVYVYNSNDRILTDYFGRIYRP